MTNGPRILLVNGKWAVLNSAILGFRCWCFVYLPTSEFCPGAKGKGGGPAWHKPPRDVVDKIEKLLESGKSITAIKNHYSLVDFELTDQQVYCKNFLVNIIGWSFPYRRVPSNSDRRRTERMGRAQRVRNETERARREKKFSISIQTGYYTWKVWWLFPSQLVISNLFRLVGNRENDSVNSNSRNNGQDGSKVLKGGPKTWPQEVTICWFWLDGLVSIKDETHHRCWAWSRIILSR